MMTLHKEFNNDNETIFICTRPTNASVEDYSTYQFDLMKMRYYLNGNHPMDIIHDIIWYVQQYTEQNIIVESIYEDIEVDKKKNDKVAYMRDIERVLDSEALKTCIQRIISHLIWTVAQSVKHNSFTYRLDLFFSYFADANDSLYITSAGIIDTPDRDPHYLDSRVDLYFGYTSDYILGYIYSVYSITHFMFDDYIRLIYSVLSDIIELKTYFNYNSDMCPSFLDCCVDGYIYINKVRFTTYVHSALRGEDIGSAIHLISIVGYHLQFLLTRTCRNVMIDILLKQFKLNGIPVNIFDYLNFDDKTIKPSFSTVLCDVTYDKHKFTSMISSMLSSKYPLFWNFNLYPFGI